jgi:hypothetical protein
MTSSTIFSGQLSLWKIPVIRFSPPGYGKTIDPERLYVLIVD